LGDPVAGEKHNIVATERKCVAKFEKAPYFGVKMGIKIPTAEDTVVSTYGIMVRMTGLEPARRCQRNLRVLISLLLLSQTLTTTSTKILDFICSIIQIFTFSLNFHLLLDQNNIRLKFTRLWIQDAGSSNLPHSDQNRQFSL
jgi:hypothetical protein